MLDVSENLKFSYLVIVSNPFLSHVSVNFNNHLVYIIISLYLIYIETFKLNKTLLQGGGMSMLVLLRSATRGVELVLLKFTK